MRAYIAVLLGAGLCIFVLAGPLAGQDGSPRTAKPSIPHNEDTARLAKDTIGRVRSLHFNLSEGAAPGYVARFTVFEGERKLGVLDASWNRPREAIRARFTGEAREGQGYLIESRGCSFLTGALTPTWNAEKVFAAETPEAYLIDSLEAEHMFGDQVRHIDHVQKDLLSWHHEIDYRDGRTQRVECSYMSNEGQAYLRNLRQETRTKDGELAERFEGTITYTHREGGVFVRRVEFRDQGTPYRLELETVEFRPPREGDPAEEGALLAEEVNGAIFQVHYSLWYRPVSSFEAHYSLQWCKKPAGTVTARWTRSRNFLEVTHDVGTARQAAELFEQWNGCTLSEWIEGDSVQWLVSAVLLGFGSQVDCLERAVRSEDGIVLDRTFRSAQQALVQTTLRLSPNGVVSSMQDRYRDGTTGTWTFEHQVADGLQVKKSATFDARTADGASWKRRFLYTYKRDGSELFPSRIEVTTNPDRRDQMLDETVLVLTKLVLRRD